MLEVKQNDNLMFATATVNEAFPSAVNNFVYIMSEHRTVKQLPPPDVFPDKEDTRPAQTVPISEPYIFEIPKDAENPSVKRISKEKIGGNTFSQNAYNCFKRVADIFLSIIGLICMFPVFLIISLIIMIDSPGKPFFAQRRVGQNGKTFRLFKFRTMRKDAEDILLYQFSKEQRIEFEKEFKLQEDPRITKTGSFLRKTSLDELPQLLNILIGNLSIVGPRPVVENELYKYGDRADKFLSVKPGLTGYWQVNGRNDVSYEKRIELDMFYIDNKNTSLDIKIVFYTFATVLKKTGY